jgi:hypothetical protein
MSVMLASDRKLVFLQNGLSAEVKRSKGPVPRITCHESTILHSFQGIILCHESTPSNPEGDSKTHLQSIFDALLAVYMPSDYCINTVLKNPYVPLHPKMCIHTMTSMFHTMDTFYM